VQNLIKQEPLKSLAVDLGKHFESGQHSDVTLVIDKTEIPAHKFILTARSPYFKAMFSHAMKETLDGRVEIKDVPLAAFRQVLRFIYTGDCDTCFDAQEKKKSKGKKTEESKWQDKASPAMMLLTAADQFQLPELADMCSEQLFNSVSIDSFAELFVFADTHHAPKLKDTLGKYIRTLKNSLPEFIATDGFKQLTGPQVHEVMAMLVPETSKKRPRDDAETSTSTKKSKTEAIAIDADE
jgi:protein required for attachment to host cells